MALDLVELITETKQELPDWLAALAKEVQGEQRATNQRRFGSGGRRCVPPAPEMALLVWVVGKAVCCRPGGFISAKAYRPIHWDVLEPCTFAGEHIFCIGAG